MGLLAALLPSALGVIGSLFKGKKTQYTAQQTPQQQAAYNQLLKMLQQRMGQQSAGYQPTFDAMNNLSQMFYGKSYPQQGQSGQQMGGFGGVPIPRRSFQEPTARR